MPISPKLFGSANKRERTFFMNFLKRSKRRETDLRAILCLACALLAFFGVFSAEASALSTDTAVQNEAAPERIRVDVMLEDSVMHFDGSDGAFLCDGVTYLPFRGFCAFFGDRELEWDGETRTATLHGVGLEISATVGEHYIVVNDRPFYCPSGVLLESGTLYVPLRALARAYGAEAAWHTDGARPAGGYAKLSALGSRAEAASDVYDADVLYWLSRIISAESRGETLEGQIAVGNVVLNRMRSDDFPSTVYDVIFDRKFGVQFTPTSNGSIYDEPARISVIAAKICLEGYTLSDSILYFLNVSAASNLWVPSNRDHVMTIGCHDFYS